MSSTPHVELQVRKVDDAPISPQGFQTEKAWEIRVRHGSGGEVSSEIITFCGMCRNWQNAVVRASLGAFANT